MVTLLPLFAEIERNFISLRTKEALASKKAQGVILGKPKGAIQSNNMIKIVDALRNHSLLVFLRNALSSDICSMAQPRVLIITSELVNERS